MQQSGLMAAAATQLPCKVQQLLLLSVKWLARGICQLLLHIPAYAKHVPLQLTAGSHCSQHELSVASDTAMLVLIMMYQNTNSAIKVLLVLIICYNCLSGGWQW